MTSTDIRKKLVNEHYADMRANDGNPSECNDTTNDLNRTYLTALHNEGKECWLGSMDTKKGQPIELTKWDGTSLVRNFACDFVVPTNDAELVRLIEQRRDAEYTGCAADSKHINAIMNRVQALGGYHFLWT
jgi:hypothetical protein